MAIPNDLNTRFKEAFLEASTVAGQPGLVVLNPDGTPLNGAGGLTANQGAPNSLANAWPIKITDGTHGPVAVTAANALTVDGSAVTQPISAASLPLPTGAATQATLAEIALDTDHLDANLSTLATQATLAAAKSDLDSIVTNTTGLATDAHLLSVLANQTNGTQSVQITDGTHFEHLTNVGGNYALDVNIVAGGGTGGTASAFGAVFPAQGTAIGFTDGTNMQGAFAYQIGAGSEYVAGANLRISNGAGSIEAKGQKAMASSIPVVIASDQSSVHITVDNATLAVTQSGAWTVTANQGGAPWSQNLTEVGGSAIALGQALMAASIPVVIASDQSSIHVTVDNATLAVTQSGTWTVQQGTPPWNIEGNIASGSADSGKPVKIGAKVAITYPTVLTDAQRADAIADTIGQIVVTPFTTGAFDLSDHLAITDNASHNLIAAQGANIFADIISLEITNASALATVLTISDGTKSYVYNLAANGGAVSNLPRPRRATSSNTAWTAQLSVAANVDINYEAIQRQ